VLKLSKLFLIVILFFVIASSRVYAISMGALVKNDFAKIAVDESAKFKILFWNLENEYILELDVKEAPENWLVLIEPNNFALNSSVGKEQIKLPYLTESVKATPTNIIVKPPVSVEPGEYELILTAKSKLPTEGIEVSQERVFKFKVEIENPLFFKEAESQNNNNHARSDSSFPTAEVILERKDENFNYFYLIFILVIILISFLIYKYS